MVVWGWCGGGEEEVRRSEEEEWGGMGRGFGLEHSVSLYYRNRTTVSIAGGYMKIILNLISISISDIKNRTSVFLYLFSV